MGYRGYGRASGDGSDAVRECPKCKSVAYRVPRNVFDRLISLIALRYRYRCESWECRWEGALRVKRRK